MLRYFLIVIALLLWSNSTRAQSFSSTTGNIPDDGTAVRFDIPVSGLPAQIDSGFGLLSVCINIVHTYANDLDIWLVAPDSTYIELSTGNGGSGQNFWSTCFADSVSTFISSASAPFTGTFRPEGPIYVANNHQNPNSTWQLLIRDTYPFADAGILTAAAITFGPNPPMGFLFVSSNLPILKINTNGQPIVDDPKIPASFQVIDNGVGVRNQVSDQPAFDGQIGIETRGSYSQTLPKKSFGFETWDSLGNEIDTTLLGLPSESDWILNANHSDKTLMRNVMTYELSRAMGHYASRTRHCEVILNGQYLGVFILMEKIKRDNGRVDIAKLTAADTTGDELTGGYILKIDKTTGTATGGFTSQHPPTNGGPAPLIQYEYPDGNTLVPQQSHYIEQYCDSFENALYGVQFADPLNGYRRYIKLDTWIDYFLINEFAKNVDGYRISTFFHKAKDSDGGLLRMGPVWDYDISWRNADYYNGSVTSGYSYVFNYSGDPFQVPFWWSRLMQDPFFRNAVRCRWNDLRTNIFSTPNLHAWIDSMAIYLDESQARNFIRWPILGVYVWPNPSPLPPDYPGVVQELKNWVAQRGAWLDGNLPGSCIPTGLSENPAWNEELAIFPNPATDETWVMNSENGSGSSMVRLYNLSGQLIREHRYQDDQRNIRIDLTGVAAGAFLVELDSGGTLKRTRLIKL
ncbi:MAG: hypothetical protein RLZZ630_2148 [Bacteroidota bacterium]